MMYMFMLIKSQEEFTYNNLISFSLYSPPNKKHREKRSRLRDDPAPIPRRHATHVRQLFIKVSSSGLQLKGQVENYAK